MKRMNKVGFALALTLLGPAMPGAALAQDRSASLSRNEMAQMDYDRGDRDDRGDRTDRWGERPRIGGIDLEGRWIIKRGYGPPPDAQSRWGTTLQTVALPRRLVIDQRRNVIRVENFRGRVFQQIVIRGQDLRDANHNGFVLGQWRDSKLVTVRSGIRDTRIIQTFALANRGRTLVVHTRQDGRGMRNDVEFTTVYQRA